MPAAESHGGATDSAASPGVTVAGMIPTFCNSWDLATRRKHFIDALAGYLDVAAGNRRALLLVAEPSLVVLLVYAIARVLPPALRDRISFSTYEPRRNASSRQSPRLPSNSARAATCPRSTIAAISC